MKQSGIRLFAFAGAGKEYQVLLDDILDGPFVGRWEMNDSGTSLIGSSTSRGVYAE